MAKPASPPAFRPLFAQIQELIIERVTAGEWQQGERLPSESEFAEYYSVSQGTVRKAIADMAAENLVVRYRGRGTFVASHTEEREHSHFFHLVGNGGTKNLPSSQPVSCRRRKANREIEQRLGLKLGAEVTVFERLRLIEDIPVVFETIVVSEALFPGFCASLKENPPNELYSHYETRYSIRVIRAVEHLRAVAANDREADALGVEVHAPLLEIDRIALTYGEKPVEWRCSHCNTRNHNYLSTLY